MIGERDFTRAARRRGNDGDGSGVRSADMKRLWPPAVTRPINVLPMTVVQQINSGAGSQPA